ncbi:MAG TPA: Asp-tRNA(Asn)/Glu-tRNA(Gln) amidotransferase subunit GatC [Thermoanaerobacterales bacterium]|jgi:aspartyl-tRNA(Asn)/glutamyl-tRNA(Gln) amidotransferase subunit C|nr:Asp-tRNA(Asn)/Glu-tRNA(Gln) amidotransferase subunit GatC [Thermoanaerobacterales bacterium]
MDKDTLERMADIAHVHLYDQEIKQISKELGFLMEHFDKLSQVDTEGITPTVHPITDKNVLREDAVWKSLPIEEVLRNAPDKDNRFFRVPRIIEE